MVLLLKEKEKLGLLFSDSQQFVPLIEEINNAVIGFL